MKLQFSTLKNILTLNVIFHTTVTTMIMSFSWQNIKISVL